MYEKIEEIYVLYYEELYRFLLTKCSDENIIEDIIQTTFLEALKSVERFKGQSSLKTWLFSIAKFQLYRYFRKAKADKNVYEMSTHGISSTNFHDEVIANEIVTAIKSLEPPHDEIMRLRLVHGLSFKAIGLQVNQTENYCRVNFFRMKEKLRKEYNDEQL